MQWEDHRKLLSVETHPFPPGSRWAACSVCLLAVTKTKKLDLPRSQWLRGKVLHFVFANRWCCSAGRGIDQSDCRSLHNTWQMAGKNRGKIVCAPNRTKMCGDKFLFVWKNFVIWILSYSEWCYSTIFMMILTWNMWNFNDKSFCTCKHHLQ